MFLDLSLMKDCNSLVSANRVSTHTGSTVTTKVALPRRDDNDDDIVISIVTCDEERSKASALINRMYARRGYGSQHDLSPGIGRTSFTVSTGGVAIGTLTLTVDSKAGLATDATFRNELDTYRRVPGARICELTRFAFDAANPSKRLLASLFHVIFIYGQRKYGCTDLFIEVAQRHRRFYEAMLGFERVCALRTNDSVGVPSQLMRLNVADIRGYIDAHCGSSSNASSRSLYPHFLSKSEELRIHKELAPVISGTVPAELHEYIGFDVIDLPKRPTSMISRRSGSVLNSPASKPFREWPASKG